MRLFKIRTESFNYYFRQELTEGYSVGEADSRFVGNDAKEFWNDTPDALSLADLVHGRKGKPRREICALDMVFAAPKSLSVQWAIETETRSEQIVRAHTRAVGAAVTYLEMVDLCRRVSKQARASTGVAGARFTHFTSRNADPHLHSHVVIGNASTFEELGAAALDVGRLTRIGPALEVIYRAELTRELKELLGLDLRGPQLGTLFLDGQPPEYVTTFSSRRNEVLDAAGEGASAHRRQIAALSTRRQKSVQDLNLLRESWRGSLEDISHGPVPRSRPREAHVGEKLLSGGGVYLSPVPDPFHSEICFQALTKPSLTLEQRLAAAAEVFEISPRPSQVASQARDRYSGVLSATTEGYNYADLSVKERPGESRPPSLSKRFLLPRSDAERRLFQSLGLLGDSTSYIVRRSALEMGSLSRLAPSQITDLVERGIVTGVRENRSIASEILDVHREPAEHTKELLRIEIDSNKIVRVFRTMAEIHAGALAHFEGITTANCQDTGYLSRPLLALEVDSVAVKESILRAARGASGVSLIRLGRSHVLAGEALRICLSSGIRSGIILSPGDSPDLIRFADLELGEIELPSSRMRWATSLSIGVASAYRSGEEARSPGAVTCHIDGGGTDVLIPKAHVSSVFDRYPQGDFVVSRCISKASVADMVGANEHAWRTRIHNIADSPYDRSRLRQMSEQLTFHKALLEMAGTYFPRIDDDREEHRRHFRLGHERSGGVTYVPRRERAVSLGLSPR